MRKLYLFICIIITVTILSCCTTAQVEVENPETIADVSEPDTATQKGDIAENSLPEWVLLTPREESYIFGIGCDEDLSTAKQRAILNAGQQFESTIKSVITNKSEDTYIKNEQFTDCIVTGTKIFDQYQADNQWWVLARAPLNCSLDVAESFLISYFLEIKQDPADTGKIIEEIEESIRNINLKPIPNGVKHLVTVEGGRFTAGTDSGQPNESPSHSVTLNSFMISRHETTQGEWLSIMGSLPTFLLYGEGRKYPIYNISWEDAVEYCNKLSIRDGLTPCYTFQNNIYRCDFNSNGYRLPTEAEWEYAAKGGIYPNISSRRNPGWYSPYSDKSTEETETSSPNSLDLYDMSGNVWEYCWDWYGEYKNTELNNPEGPEEGKMRVIRGGAWDSIIRDVSIYSRGRVLANERFNSVGFRIARSIR